MTVQSLADLNSRLLVDLLRDRSKPRKSLGQHFLIDDEVIARTLELASENGRPLGQGSHVLEIGPGPGSLTLSMLRSGAKVSAIEIDNDIVSHIQRVFGRIDCGLEVFEADAIQASWPAGITHIISNLPFQISSPILERIRVQHSRKPLELVILLVQKEFADRMAMSSMPYDAGSLGLNLWLDFDVSTDRKVPPNSFIPSPKVNSALVVLRPLVRPEIEALDKSLFRIVTKHCFSNRRRKLRTLLSKAPRRISRVKGWHKERWQSTIVRLLESEVEGLPSDWAELRPESLDPIDWVLLVKGISS